MADTFQVAESSDDCFRRLVTSSFQLANVSQWAGCDTADFIKYGGGMRFTNVTIPNGATIVEAHLTLRASGGRAVTVVNTRISAEDVDDAITFANDAGAFDTRWANRTTARVDWDGIGEWVADVDYDSPDIKAVIKEIVDRGGWASGQDIVIFWDDFDDRSDHNANCNRIAYSFDGDEPNAPKLVVTYTTGAPAAKRTTSMLDSKPRTRTRFLPTLGL